jgi:hypothetical protein
MQAELNSQLTVQSSTARIHVKCTAQERNLLVEKLREGCVKAGVGSYSVTTGFHTINLPWPLSDQQIQVVRTIASSCPHEIKVDGTK